MVLLSIVVPFYNVETFVVPCLESLRRQTLEDFEVILVDDGSRDRTGEYADEFATRDKRFRIVRQENRGLGPARNAGVRESTGEFLTFVDSDDVVDPHAYAIMVGSLLRTGSDFAAARAFRFNNLGTTPSHVHRLALGETRLRTHIRSDRDLALDRMAWNKVYRRSFYAEAGLEFPAMLLEDFPVSIRAHARARSVDALSDIVYFWRQRDGGEPSITQRAAEIDNVRDRVASAIDVLDVATAEAPNALPLLRRHFLEVDVHAIVSSLILNAEEDHETIVGLARELSLRIGVEQRHVSPAYYKVQAALVDKGDVSALLELQHYLQRFGRHAVIRRFGRFRKRYLETLPLLESGKVGKDLFEPMEAPLYGISVEDAEWRGGRLELAMRIDTRLPLGGRSRFEAWLDGDGGGRIPLEVERDMRPQPLVGEDLIGARVAVDPGSILAECAARPGSWTVRTRLTTQEYCGEENEWNDNLGRGRFVRPVALDDHGLLLQPAQMGGALVMRVRRPKVVATGARVVDGSIELTGRLRVPRLAGPVQLVLTGRRDEVLRFAADTASVDDGTWSFTTRVAADAVVEFPDYLRPFDMFDTMMARMDLDGTERQVAIAPEFTGAQVVHGTRVLCATMGPAGNLLIIESRVAPLLTGICWADDAVLRFQGEWPGQDSLPDHVLFELFETPESSVQLRIPMASTGAGTYSYEVDCRELIRVAAAVKEYEGVAKRPWQMLVPFGERLGLQTYVRESLVEYAAPRMVEGRRIALSYGRNNVVRLLMT